MRRIVGCLGDSHILLLNMQYDQGVELPIELEKKLYAQYCPLAAVIVVVLSWIRLCILVQYDEIRTRPVNITAATAVNTYSCEYV